MSTSVMERIEPARLAQELAAARPALGDAQQRLALALYQLLAEGRPVSPERLAQHAGSDLGEVTRLLEPRYGVELDADGAVESFWGLRCRRRDIASTSMAGGCMRGARGKRSFCPRCSERLLPSSRCVRRPRA